MELPSQDHSSPPSPPSLCARQSSLAASPTPSLWLSAGSLSGYISNFTALVLLPHFANFGLLFNHLSSQPPRREAPTLLSWRWHRKHTTPQPWANHLKSQSWGPSSAGPANPGAGPERIVSPVPLVTISLIREESETSRADKRRLLSSAFWNVLKNYCSFSIFNSLLHPALP